MLYKLGRKLLEMLFFRSKSNFSIKKMKFCEEYFYYLLAREV